MKSLITLIIVVSLCSALFDIEANAARVKDIAQLHGVRNNQLLGYGLVTGLDGTGDDLKKSVFTLQAIYPAASMILNSKPLPRLWSSLPCLPLPNRERP